MKYNNKTIAKISIVIPSYNSQNSISLLLEGLIKQINKTPYDHEVIIINDNSTDNTKDEVINYKNSNPRSNVKLFESKVNLGQVASTLFGISQSTGEIVVTIDDDLQHDPINLIPMLEYFLKNNIDAVVGYWDADETPLRNATSALFNLISNIIKLKSLNYRNTAFRLFSSNLNDSFLNYFINKNWIDLRFISKKVGQIKVNHNPPHNRDYTSTIKRAEIAFSYLIFDTLFFELLLVLSFFSVNFISLIILFILSIFKYFKKRNLKLTRAGLLFDSDNYFLI
tara:strand:+ start:9393 stop:10238 length:846 start_codon:yes stop_codon:yes gene_type:complete